MTTQLNGASRLFPIIGDPVKYAESPVRLTQTFVDRGRPGVCVPLEIRADDLQVALAALSIMRNVDGILVTMPHKAAVVPHCSTLSRRSTLLGVVSHMRRNADGTWHGDVFDGISFVQAQIDNGATVEGARALLFGAGGAGSAIAIDLVERGVSELVIHDPNEARVAELIADLAGIGAAVVRAGSADPTGMDLVLNATPMGMNEDDPLPVDPALLKDGMFVGDVVAGHGVTRLIAAARAAGCGTATGADMVIAGLKPIADFMSGAVAG